MEYAHSSAIHCPTSVETICNPSNHYPIQIRLVTRADAQPGSRRQMQVSHTACFSLKISQQTIHPTNHRPAKQSASQAVPCKDWISHRTEGLGKAGAAADLRGSNVRKFLEFKKTFTIVKRHLKKTFLHT